jgi:hypothetical protein
MFSEITSHEINADFEKGRETNVYAGNQIHDLRGEKRAVSGSGTLGCILKHDTNYRPLVDRTMSLD